MATDTPRDMWVTWSRDLQGARIPLTVGDVDPSVIPGPSGLTGRSTMKHIQPISLEEARDKVLPILTAGHERRGRSRSERERRRRNALKNRRDDERSEPPRLCAL